MARYLHNIDYKYTIQNSQLNQLLQIGGIGGAPVNTLPAENSKLNQAERIAIDEVSSYLVQRWDTSMEFAPLTIYSYTASYTAGSRVILDYQSFSSSVSYATGSYVISNSDAYISTTLNTATTSTPSDGANWLKLGSQYDMFYVKTPYPMYDDREIYRVGDIITWVGHTWSCLYNTKPLSHDEMLQYGRLENIPDPNVMPTDRSNSSGKYWHDSGTFSITNVYPFDTNYFVNGDNRCQQIIVAVQDIAIYHLSKSISPENVPEFRALAYRNALKLLKNAADGQITLSMPVKEPTQGLKARFVGGIRRNNNI